MHKNNSAIDYEFCCKMIEVAIELFEYATTSSIISQTFRCS